MSDRCSTGPRLLACATLAATGCSLGIQGVDPKWDGKIEPVCGSGAVTFDQIFGASLLIAASGTLAKSPSGIGAAVTVPFAAAGVLYELAALRGGRRVSECQRARAQWRNSNMIKPIDAAPPGQAVATAAPAPAVARPTPAPATASQRVPASQAPRAPPAPIASAPTSSLWAAGVSDAEQALARRLYVAGNHAFVERRYAEALAIYKRAITHWDHPAIRFNMVVCLIELGQPIEARGHLERSLAYGVEAIGADAHAKALAYRDRLDRMLVRLTLDCPEPGEEILLDGQLIFVGPGQVSRFVLPGEHQVVGSKRGYLPVTKRIVLVAGRPETYQIRLDPSGVPP
jgi:hypothetical protein